jgi:predicted GNAT superfamily acetyltransferase
VIEVRRLCALSEFSEAVKLEQCIWGFADTELMPPSFFVVAAEIGGQVFGAFLSGQMVGFCVALPGIKPDGRPYLHSHMLGVLRDHRDRGTGRMLKLEQRSDALTRGIDLIEWTFDPLEVKNAYFNIQRLGVIVRHYIEDLYGPSTSPLHGGLPTDRCIAEWWIGSGVGQAPRPASAIEDRISVPTAIHEIRRNDPERAREIQRANADRFQASFSKGLAVIGFERNETEGVYLLGRWP